jgi:5-formyltetrahydrofolate cyclo-ligase
METEAQPIDVARQKNVVRERYEATSQPGEPGESDLDWGKIAALIRACPSYRQARHILVPPSSFFYQVRLNALMDRKLLTVPSPGMQKGFQHFDPVRLPPRDRIPAARLRKAGARLTGDAYNAVLPRPVDLVIGEAICAAADGSLIGDGKGHLDLLFGLLSTLRWLHAKALFLAVVREREILSSCPQEAHDVKVHWLATPQNTVRTSHNTHPKGAILWEQLSDRQIRRNEVLFNLAVKLCRIQGKCSPITGPREKIP